MIRCLLAAKSQLSVWIASRPPTARQFKRWVTSEVLPSIRKHGAYATSVTIDRIVADPDFGIRLLAELKTEQERNTTLALENAVQAQQLAEAKPRVGYYDVVLASPSLVKTAVSAATRKPKKNNFKWHRRGCSITNPAICGFLGLQNKYHFLIRPK